MARSLTLTHVVVEQDLGDDTFLVRVTTETGKNPVRSANAAAARPDVEYAEPNLVRTLQRMFLPADPLFAKQWHLHAPLNDGDVSAGAKTYSEASTPALRGLVGREIKGTWTLQVSDQARFDSGELRSWELIARVKAG